MTASLWKDSSRPSGIGLQQNRFESPDFQHANPRWQTDWILWPQKNQRDIPERAKKAAAGPGRRILVSM